MKHTTRSNRIPGRTPNGTSNQARLTRKHWLTTLALSLALGVAVVAVGCQQDVIKGPGQARQDPMTGSYPRNVALQGLDEVLVVEPAIVTPSTESTPMEVVVPLRSVGDERLNIQYRFEFFDEAGRPLRSSVDWKYLGLAPRMQVFLRGNALDTTARDWRVTVRPSQ